jgi:hypothetical protein
VRAGAEADALGAHLLQTAVDEVLLHLEIGNAVAQQAADAVGLLEDRDLVAGARQLLRRGQSRGTGADDGDALAGLGGRRLGRDKALGEGAVDDGLFDLLDGDRRRVDAQHAGGFARRGTDAAGEFGEIVGGVQLAHGLAPAPRDTNSFQSGIRLVSGQPLWQNGTPQSMQRVACVRSFCSGNGR